MVSKTALLAIIKAQHSMQAHAYDIIYQNEATNWWYRVRRKIVCNMLARYQKKSPTPLRILDIGCGTGLLMQEMQRYGTVEGVDISAQAIAYCKERGLSTVQEASAEVLPYPSESFDVVVILDVLEHLKDDSAGLNEIKRVLVPGGRAIITVPAFMFLWSITDVLSEHYRRYTRREICAAVKKTGLHIQRATYFNTFLFPAIAAVRLSVRVFRIKMKSETRVGGSIGNAIFYALFRLESFLLPYVSFPFGVSVLIIAQK